MCETTMKTSRLVTRVALFASAAFSFLNASAADIVSVTGAQRNGQEIVQIQLDESIDFNPSAFVVQSPARISLDFPSVGVKSGRQNIEVNQGNLRSISVVEAGDRSRVVLNLREATAYQIQRSGSVVTVSLNPAAPSGPAIARSSIGKVGGQTSSDAQQLGVAHGLKNIDFRKGVDGAGRLILSMPDGVAEVDLRQEGRKIVLEIPNATLSPALRNRLDVMDFGTPVQFVQARQVGNSTLVEVETVGEWSQSAYQADGQYVLEVREVVPDPTKLTQGLGFTGEKLSLNFQNIEIRSLLQVIADFTNFNIVTSDSVQGSLTLRLQDVPWDQAFQIILDSKALGYEKNGNVLWVAPKQELDARKQQDYEAQLALQKLEPLRTQIFQLNYAKADYIAQQLTGSGSNTQVSGDANNNRFLTARGSAIAEKRTNQLFVTDTPSRLEDVTRLIASWDIPVRQVLIEARIVEATDNFGRNLGVRLGASDLRAERGGEGGYNIGGGNSVVVGGSYDNVLTSSGAASGTSANGQFFNFGAADIGTASAATFALSIFNSAANRFLNLELSALEATGQGRVISSPRIVTADQVEAFIEQGTEIPYATTSPNGASTVEFKKAVMRLGVTPQITPEGNVILDLEVNKDSPTVSAGAVAVDTKKVTTQVLVENGGTVVIGGIFELIESTGETKVPFLGDLPIAGHLFKSTTRSVTKSELMVFITPKIVTDQNSMRR